MQRALRDYRGLRAPRSTLNGLRAVEIRLPGHDGAFDLIRAEILGERAVEERWELCFGCESKRHQLCRRQTCKVAVAADASQPAHHFEPHDAVLQAHRVGAADEYESKDAARKHDECDREDGWLTEHDDNQ